MRTIIRNGKVVTADNILQTDLLISDGRIEKVDAGEGEEEKADTIIEASGLYVLPGGIDPHVHFHLPTPAGYSADDFDSGSTAALAGGTTTVLDFVTPTKGQSLKNALELRMKEAEPCHADYGFHVSPISWHKNIPAEIAQCVDAGITSFKVYMAYLETVGLMEQDLKSVFEAIAGRGGKVLVHCELGLEIQKLKDEYLLKGCTSPSFHPLTRPNHLEAAAVKKAVSIARQTGCALYIVHVSAKESIEHIRKAKDQGLEVYAETCPQYLLLDDAEYLAGFDRAAACVMSPPLRKKEDTEALWEAISAGIIDSIGTDHCPFTLQQKRNGLDNFTLIPNGAGGVEHRLSLMHHFGVLKGRFDLRRFVELTSANPARIFDLYPRKGVIARGADADLVLWNPDREIRISAATHHQNSDINIYEGITTRGAPEYVLARGVIAVEKGKLNTGSVNGNFLRRKIS